MADITQANVKKVIPILTLPEEEPGVTTLTESRTTTSTEPEATEFTESCINNDTTVLCKHSSAGIAPDS